MAKIKHNNIPIFIPERACPHRCVFCNQANISSVHRVPEPEEVSKIVSCHLASSDEKREREIAFFGGSFTGLPIEIQRHYLAEAHQFVLSGQVQGIRISTRPDYISPEIIDLLKSFGVTAVELGAQSTDAEVLRLSGRGHTRESVREASAMLLDAGFELGLQMMIGLPGDSVEKSLRTARDIVDFGAQTTRIYPTLVVADTPLEKLFAEKRYQPLLLNQAVELSAQLYDFFVSHGVRVIRVGLHPSEDLTPEKALIAGPFHRSFKELVMTRIWKSVLSAEIKKTLTPRNLVVTVTPAHLNHAAGYMSENRKYFKKMGFRLKFATDTELSDFDCRVREL